MICPSCSAQNVETAETCASCGERLLRIERGTRLAGRYEVVALLGAGGMGVVYKARDLKLDEMVALKVLRADVARAADSARRFRTEIKLARRVRHRNVCGIHEYHEDGSLRIIAMELVEGVDLRRRIREQGALPPPEAYEVAIQAANGLGAIHEVGILHRDIKTSNLMRDPRGVVRFMDFGIAKELTAQDATGLTAAGQVVGTAEYMSPEQAQGQKLDARSDLYALGIVIFELFTGAVPFRGATPVATLYQHLREPPPLDRATLPTALVPVLRKALAKTPEARFASARELADALAAARQQLPLPPGPAERISLASTATWPGGSPSMSTEPPPPTRREADAVVTLAPPATALELRAAPTPTRVTAATTLPRRRPVHPVLPWLLGLGIGAVAVALGLIAYVSLRPVGTRAGLPLAPERTSISPGVPPVTAAPQALQPSAAPSPAATLPPALTVVKGAPLAAGTSHSARVAAPPTIEPARLGAGEPPATRRPVAMAASFVPGPTTFTAPATVSPRGFRDPPPGVEIHAAQAPAPRAQLVIEATPSVIRAGDRYLLRYSIFNIAAVPLTIGAVSLRNSPDAPAGGAVEPQSRSAKPQSRTLLFEAAGTWTGEDPAQWATTLLVVLDDGSVYSSTLRARRQ